MVDRLTQAYAGKVTISRVDMTNQTAEGKRLIAAYHVQYQPTFVFVSSGGVVQATVVGELSESALRAKLDALR